MWLKCFCSRCLWVRCRVLIPVSHARWLIVTLPLKALISVIWRCGHCYTPTTHPTSKPLNLTTAPSGVPAIELDKQGRSRASLAELYNWRYKKLGNLPHVLTSPEYLTSNPGFSFDFQVSTTALLPQIRAEELLFKIFLFHVEAQFACYCSRD